ncbi:MAG: ribosome-associated translation inhibitor RaiA [Alphaproteobacteria bacterium]|nr:ribosome-associated translation inhibitor RaiA [Alphaproteobacteria bacterium]
MTTHAQLPDNDAAPTELKIQVKGKQIDVGDSLRQHVQQHLSDVVSKYFNTPLDATVVFSREAHLYRADISVHAARGIMLQSNYAANDPYPAFDEAAGRIAKRLSRHKKRLLDMHQHQGDKHAAFEAMVARKYVLNPENEESGAANEAHTPLIVAETTTNIEHLTVSEAVMKLDLAELPALLFNNRAHGKLNMVYRRADGHIGWVDPANAPQNTASKK